MFEVAEIGQEVSKEEYEAAIPELRVDLVNAQYDLQSADFFVVIEIAGDDWPACVEAVQSMHEWMDQRYIETQALDADAGSGQGPTLGPYWRRLPRRGRIGLFLDGWTQDLIRDAVNGRVKNDAFARRLDHIERFERALVDDGALLLKFWFHLGKDELGKRLKKARKDPEKYWWVDEEASRRLYEHYDEARPVAERVLSKMSSGEAPWTLINSSDSRYRNLELARALRERLCGRLAAARPAAVATPPPAAPAEERRTVLDTVDLSRSLAREDYDERLADLQAELRRQSAKAQRKGVACALVFEGWDAAGKGGIIRRLTRPLDPRRFRVHPISAPTEEEAAHHYLWRFWQRLPRAGDVAVFDRSWYGRVLVERVEGLADEAAWRRAYAEIRDFEEQLAEAGIALLKFWLHIDPDEQLRRFEARAQTPFKKYKLTEDDYRNREKWGAYVAAVDEMVARTSTSALPWHLVPSNDKRFARVEVLKTFAKALEARL